MNKRSGARKRSEPANEWAVRASERADKRVAQYLCLDSWLFRATVEAEITSVCETRAKVLQLTVDSLLG